MPRTTASKQVRAALRAEAAGFLDDRAFRFYEPLPSTKQFGKADVDSLTELLVKAYEWGRKMGKAGG